MKKRKVFKSTEAVVWGRTVKKVFLNISQNSKETTCVENCWPKSILWYKTPFSFSYLFVAFFVAFDYFIGLKVRLI